MASPIGAGEDVAGIGGVVTYPITVSVLMYFASQCHEHTTILHGIHHVRCKESPAGRWETRAG